MKSYIEDYQVQESHTNNEDHLNSESKGRLKN